MHKRNFLITYRLFFAALVSAAVATQLNHSIQTHASVASFFSFFTIQANIFAAIIFIVSAALLYTKRTWPPIDALRGASTTYMVITGVVFAILLADLTASLQTTIPWVNSVLHELFPVVVFLDWVIDRPLRRIMFARALWWLVFPIAYLAYSLIRGPIVQWYPYPFLNPAEGGYAKVAIVSACIAIFCFALVAVLAWSTRWHEVKVANKRSKRVLS